MPRNEVTSSAPRSSMAMSSPLAVAMSTVASGATTRNGTPAWRAARASEKDPTLLAVSPLRVIRSAPMRTMSARPRARTEAAAESTSSRNGAPMPASSQAVRRAPWSRGRVSSGSASSSRPRACSSPMTPSAVPRSTAARAPVLQIVMARIRGRATSSRARSAPRDAIEAHAAMSSSRIRRASSRMAPGPSARRASARSTPQARFTAVGRAARRRAAPSRMAASSPACANASRATPSPPATPSAGAPRTASRAIASISGSKAVMRRTTSSSGRRVWSMRRISPSTQSIVRISAPSSQVADPRRGRPRTCPNEAPPAVSRPSPGFP